MKADFVRRRRRLSPRLPRSGSSAERGAIRNRSGDRYKPSALRGYEQALRLRLLPPLGAHKLSDIGRADLQRLVARWQEAGLSPSSIRNTVNALRTIYRSSDLLTDGTVAANPTIGLRLPAVRGKRDRIAPPDEASRLLAALPSGDRAVWATALYAGLRAGELRALAWEHVDLGGGTIRVLRSYDPKAGFVEPKSRAGVRRVPIASVLREQLIEHRVLSGRHTGLFSVDLQTGRSAEDDEQPRRAPWRSGGSSRSACTSAATPARATSSPPGSTRRRCRRSWDTRASQRRSIGTGTYSRDRRRRPRAA